ncbi:MAG: chloride channel protein [Anaerolineales bacterium]|nr:chloride channel protein [Anaerolineales bacterium]
MNQLRTTILRLVQHSERTNLIILSILVGLCSGIGVWLFSTAIEVLQDLHANIHDINPLYSVAILVGTGLLVGWIMQSFIGEERHHGVAGIMEAVALGGGRMRYYRMPYKIFASILSIGGGASVGPEDPSVQIGANIGSFFGQKLHFSEEQMRLLVGAGSASAISAVFNAPIAGVFFALEIVLGEFTSGAFGVVVLSSVVSSVFVKAVEIHGPELGIRDYALGGVAEVPFYVLLGLIAAPIAVIFMRMVYWQHDFWHHVHLPRPYKTALAGVIVGVVAIFYPEIMGTGRETMTEVLNSGGAEEFGLTLLLGLVVAKMVMTSISLGSGFVGGIFAPSLFVGATFGGAYGYVIEQLLPNANTGNPAAFAIAGMAAVMAGVVRAPITAILLIFEVTDDYQLILPIMLTTVICLIIAERFEPYGIYSLSLRRKGLDIHHGRDVDVMQSVFVSEAMVKPAPTIRCDATLTQLRDRFREAHTKAVCVVNEQGILIGIATMSDLQRAYEASNGQPLTQTVKEIMTTNLITITPDEPVWNAIRRMGTRGIGSLPVVDVHDEQKVVGLVRRHDIMRVYNIAIARKWEAQYHETQIRLNTLIGEKVIEVKLNSRSPIVGQRVQDVTWPQECIIASIRRDRRIILPHGYTKLVAGDALIVVIDPKCEHELYQLVSTETKVPQQPI